MKKQKISPKKGNQNDKKVDEKKTKVSFHMNAGRNQSNHPDDNIPLNPFGIPFNY